MQLYGMHPAEGGQSMGHSKSCAHAPHLFREDAILNSYKDTMQDTGAPL